MHMIYCQGQIATPAVLATKSIPPEYILPVQHNAFERNSDKKIESDDARERKTSCDRADHFFRMVCNRYGFTTEQQEQGSLGIADAQWFVTAVQYQNF